MNSQGQKKRRRKVKRWSSKILLERGGYLTIINSPSSSPCVISLIAPREFSFFSVGMVVVVLLQRQITSSQKAEIEKQGSAAKGAFGPFVDQIFCYSFVHPYHPCVVTYIIHIYRKRPRCTRFKKILRVFVLQSVNSSSSLATLLVE